MNDLKYKNTDVYGRSKKKPDNMQVFEHNENNKCMNNQGEAHTKSEKREIKM